MFSGFSSTEKTGKKRIAPSVHLIGRRDGYVVQHAIHVHNVILFRRERDTHTYPASKRV